MDRYEIVREILEKNHFENYEVLNYDKYFETNNPIKKLVRKLFRDGSWCDFSPNDTTRIYLKESEEKDKELGNVFVAAHEASHALNYKENLAQFRLLKYLQNIYLTLYILSVFLFVAFFIIAVTTFEHSLIDLRYLVYIMLVVTGLGFGYLHKYDEKRTDLRAAEELKKHIYSNESDVKRIDELVQKRYKERIRDILFLKVAFPIMLIILDTAVKFIFG